MESIAIRLKAIGIISTGGFEMQKEQIADLLYRLISVDRTSISIDNGIVSISQNGLKVSLTMNANTVIRNSISRY
jgi:tRNA threonylcarbamoyladenosine modification (KEOPS) complex  Pcc1 subunit